MAVRTIEVRERLMAKNDEYAAEVRERLRLLAPGGGFVFNTIHNIQARTPIENVIAMLDALREFNGQ